MPKDKGGCYGKREREPCRQEHHEQMQEWARVQGRTLADMPAGGGHGMGAGEEPLGTCLSRRSKPGRQSIAGWLGKAWPAEEFPAGESAWAPPLAGGVGPWV